MSYIGAAPTTAAFLVDTFSGDAVTTSFTLTVAPATPSSIIVAISGLVQDPSTYGVVNRILTFSGTPPVGTGNISVRYLGIPASGVTTTAYRTVTEYTALAAQTTWTIPSYTVGYVDVYQNGIQLTSSDFTASDGVNVVLTVAATLGDAIRIVSFYVSGVNGALGSGGGNLTGNFSVGGNALFADATNDKVGIGTNTPAANLQVIGSTIVSGDLSVGGAVIATNGFLANSNTVANNYTVTAGTNALSVGPLTLTSNVTVSNGARWIII